MKKKISISVRNLVESTLRSGDIDDSYRSINRALEGTKAHQKLQKSYKDNYISEYSLSHSLEYENMSLEVKGRADGIFLLPEIMIQEIKSTNRDLDRIEEDYNPLHLAQAKCYGFIYMYQEGLEKIGLKLTYFNLKTEETKDFDYYYSYEELREFFYGLVDSYRDWSKERLDWIDYRNTSIGRLDFPFKEYRPNQREMAVAVYRTISNSKKIFIEAATGIGKTISTVFPTIKAMNEGLVSKIFYVTAKTITREAPIGAVRLMADQGLALKTIVITAKEKVCLNHKLSCNPEDCKYAKGHFDRVNDAIREIFKEEDLFTRELILKYAEEYRVCPFELSLDLALWSDLIVADYNYIFDPQVRLKRFFDLENQDYVFLVDEAHNLVDRSRSMYSAELRSEDISRMLEIFKDRQEEKKTYKSILRLLNKMDGLKESMEEDESYSQLEEDQLLGSIRSILNNLDGYLSDSKKDRDYDQVLDFYFELLRYQKISEFYNDGFLSSKHRNDQELVVRVNAIDTSSLLKETMALARATILFSATLTPMEYYMDLLGANGRDYHIRLASAFPEENLKMLIANKSTRYKDRPYSLDDIVELIYRFTRAKRGNYLVFFPSYSYMEEAYYRMIDSYLDVNISRQDQIMTEEEREDFIKDFYKSEDLVAFAVLGGIFSEGIDIKGDNLIGAVIVGVGMPKLSFYNNMLRDFFDDLGNGFNYAYIYPGMNKVFQALGRVIRDEEDRGSLLLIDDRYLKQPYRSLFPRHLNRYSLVNKNNIDYELKNFWN